MWRLNQGLICHAYLSGTGSLKMGSSGACTQLVLEACRGWPYVRPSRCHWRAPPSCRSAQ